MLDQEVNVNLHLSWSFVAVNRCQGRQALYTIVACPLQKIRFNSVFSFQLGHALHEMMMQ